MGVHKYIIFFLLWVLGAAAGHTDTVELQIEFPVICDNEMGYQYIPFEYEIPPIISFLREVGSEIKVNRSDVNGMVNVRTSDEYFLLTRKEFGLNIAFNSENETMIGALEVFNTPDYCKLIQGDFRLFLSEGITDFAEMKVGASISGGVRLDDLAHSEAVDLIGRRYFSEFKEILPPNFGWIVEWEKEMDKFQNRTASSVGMCNEDNKFDPLIGDNGMQMITFIEHFKLFEKAMSDDPDSFSLSNMGFEVSAYWAANRPRGISAADRCFDYYSNWLAEEHGEEPRFIHLVLGDIDGVHIQLFKVGSEIFLD